MNEDELEGYLQLDRQERAAVAALERLAKKWPKSLWLFSASGSLLVMKQGPDGGHVHEENNSVDRRYEVAHILGIENDGGDF